MYRYLAGILLLCSSVVMAEDSWFQLRPEFETILRAQSPDDSQLLPPLSAPSATPAPSASSPYNPFSTPGPQDPFLVQPGPYASGSYQPGTPPNLGPLYSHNGPQPYRYGWTPKYDFAYLPTAHTSPNVGNFSILELDSEFVFHAQAGPDWVLTMGPRLNYRQYDATKAGTLDLYHFGVNLQLATPASAGPIGWQFGFTPSLNTDFQSQIASEAVNLDFNAMMFYQVNSQLMAVLGVGLLDRVDTILLPYAGVVYTPTPEWELRLLFPQGRISRYLGEFWWGSHWLYLNWEYHVESFQVSTPGNRRNQLQYEDYRVTFGMRSDHPGFTKYIEAGYVFGRDVEYKGTLPGFDISDGLIIRGGIRF